LCCLIDKITLPQAVAYQEKSTWHRRVCIFMRYEWQREAIDRRVDWLCHALSVEG